MHAFKFLLVAVLILLAGGPVTAHADPSASEIVGLADSVVWGKSTLQGEFEMTLITPTWSRSLTLKVWMDRPTRTFARVVAPAKEMGLGSLSINTEMWNYVPSIERTIKIPPSLMLQPWFGSDFTSDDMMRQDSVIKNYSHRVLGEKDVDGSPAYEIELLPKPDAPVAWGKIVSLIRKSDYLPLQEDYYDERGNLARQMVYSEPHSIGGRTRPTRLEMRLASNPGKRTVLRIKSLVIDQPIDPGVFSLRNLTSRE